MAVSQGTSSFGAVVQIEQHVGVGDYASVGELIKASRTGTKVTQIKLTNLTSPNHFHEFTNGFGDGGKVQFDINAVKSAVSTLYSYVQTTRSIQLLWPLQPGESTPSSWTCNANLEEIGEEFPEDDRMTVPVTFQLTGKPVFAQGH